MDFHSSRELSFHPTRVKVKGLVAGWHSFCLFFIFLYIHTFIQSQTYIHSITHTFIQSHIHSFNHTSESLVLHGCASRLREFIAHRPIGFSINNEKCSHSAKSEPRHLDHGPATDLLQIFESGSRSGEIKGIVQPFELGGVTRLIWSAVKFCMAGNLKKNFNGTISREELKTDLCGLMISEMTLSNQSHFPRFFSPRKMTYRPR